MYDATRRGDTHSMIQHYTKASPQELLLPSVELSKQHDLVSDLNVVAIKNEGVIHLKQLARDTATGEK